MLLEAYHLLKNRIGQGQSDSSAHESFSTNISKAIRTWRLILNSDGSIHGIDPMGDADAAGYWSLVKGTSAKEKRFPALRPKTPLVLLDVEDERWDELEKASKKENIVEAKALLLRILRESSKGSFDLVGIFTNTVTYFVDKYRRVWHGRGKSCERFAYAKKEPIPH